MESLRFTGGQMSFFEKVKNRMTQAFEIVYETEGFKDPPEYTFRSFASEDTLYITETRVVFQGVIVPLIK